MRATRWDSETETVLYVVRHGETEYNRRRIVQGRKIDATLNEAGRRQAAALARRLAGERLDAIYASTLRRARETADAVAAKHPGIPVRHLRDLEEMSWGDYEGRPIDEHVLAMYEKMEALWQAGDFSRPVTGGESIAEVQERGLKALDHILTRHRGKTVLVVAHGRFIRVLLASILPGYGLERMREIKHANTGVNRLRFGAGAPAADLLNCTAHLEVAETAAVG
ncbi:histidine phosphatase family protein [Rhodocaloribacter sp.]